MIKQKFISFVVVPARELHESHDNFLPKIRKQRFSDENPAGVGQQHVRESRASVSQSWLWTIVIACHALKLLQENEGQNGVGS